MTHIEIHWLETAKDAKWLEFAGLPRIDLEPSSCTSCNARVGEVNGAEGTVFWKPCGLVLNGDAIGTVCRKCFAGIDKALAAR